MRLYAHKYLKTIFKKADAGAGWDGNGLLLRPALCCEVGTLRVRFHAIIGSWLSIQCFECFAGMVSGTVLPPEVFSLAAVRRSLACFPMILCMIVFLYKIMIYYQYCSNHSSGGWPSGFTCTITCLIDGYLLSRVWWTFSAILCPSSTEIFPSTVISMSM